MIRDVGSKYDDYSVSPKIRQILLHWGYELTDFFDVVVVNWTNYKKKNKNKNELLSFQQKRNLAKSERKIF